MQRSKCAESGYRALSGPQTRSITLGMRSKRPKVRGHRAIAQFSAWVGIVGDPYSVRVSSSCHSKKAIVRRIGLLNGGFRPVVVSTRFMFYISDGVLGTMERRVRLSAWICVPKAAEVWAVGT